MHFRVEDELIHLKIGGEEVDVSKVMKAEEVPAAIAQISARASKTDGLSCSYPPWKKQISS